MPYSTQRDRSPADLEVVNSPWPAAPLNVTLTRSYQRGSYDLVWDDPSILAANSRFVLLGVNIYRSFDSEFGPFHRVTPLPLGSTFWRDQTDNELIGGEDVSNRFIQRGPEHSAAGVMEAKYIFRTWNWPIVKPGSQATLADTAEDVRVEIDGIRVPVLRVNGASGEVEIDNLQRPDVALQTAVAPRLPGANSRVTCSYRYNRSLLRTDLLQRVFYRIVTVGIPIEGDLSTVQSQDLVETPLEHGIATSNSEIEKLDYIWREAIRRNRWILEQGGERVKVFLKKNVGVACSCFQDDYHKQPQADCVLCYGCGIKGGYEGPYPIIIAPDDADRKISQKDIGRTVEHSYETWTGPSPLLAHRDFLLMINGERYSIGSIRRPTSRGMVLQQHFMIGCMDEKDIRYRVPVGDPVKYAAVQFAPTGPEHEAEAAITDKPEIPEEQQLRGRSPAWEDSEY